MDDVPAYQIARLTLCPGDVLVAKCKGTLRTETTALVYGILRSRVPAEVPIIVIDDGVDLSILTATDIASRAEATNV